MYVPRIIVLSVNLLRYSQLILRWFGTNKLSCSTLCFTDSGKLRPRSQCLLFSMRFRGINWKYALSTASMAHNFDSNLSFGEDRSSLTNGFRSLRSVSRVSGLVTHKRFRHPFVVMAHVGFRASAIFFYVFANIFAVSFIIQFLVIVSVFWRFGGVDCSRWYSSLEGQVILARMRSGYRGLPTLAEGVLLARCKSTPR